MRANWRSAALMWGMVAAAMAAGPASKPVDPVAAYRDEFAIADKLDVTSVAVDDKSAADGPTAITMTCRMRAAGTYTFAFDAQAKGGPPRTLTMAWPAPSTRFASVRPGGIHGGPPLVMSRHPPMVVRSEKDAAVVSVRWSHGESAGPSGGYGYHLAKTSFTPAAGK